MGKLVTILTARVFIALAGILVYITYLLLDAFGSPAALFGIGMLMVAFVFALVAIACSIASHDEWDLVRFRAMKKRGVAHSFC